MVTITNSWLELWKNRGQALQENNVDSRLETGKKQRSSQRRVVCKKSSMLVTLKTSVRAPLPPEVPKKPPCSASER